MVVRIGPWSHKGSPTEKDAGSIRALPKWGVGAGVWSTYLEKNCPCLNGHLLLFGGSEPLPGWLGALMQ